MAEFGLFLVILCRISTVIGMNRIFAKVFLVSLMMFVSGSIQAQEAEGFKKIDVKEDFAENGFTWFHDAELLAAGNKKKTTP